MHICHEELLVLMAGLPFLSVLVSKIRAKLHKKKPCECEHERQEVSHVA